MSEVCLDLTESRGLGDTICATPTLKKLYYSYGKKIAVLTHHPIIFKNNTFVSELWSTQNSNREVLEDRYEMLNSFLPNVENKFGISLRHNQFDIRQFHAAGLGFQLLPNEMEMEFIPDKFIEIENLPKSGEKTQPKPSANNKITVILNGEEGVIDASQWEAFRKKYPTAKRK